MLEGVRRCFFFFHASASGSHWLPVVLTQQEVKELLRSLQGTPWIMANILYGVRLRLVECLRLRVKDIDLGTNRLVVREGKATKTE